MWYFRMRIVGCGQLQIDCGARFDSNVNAVDKQTGKQTRTHRETTILLCVCVCARVNECVCLRYICTLLYICLCCILLLLLLPADAAITITLCVCVYALYGCVRVCLCVYGFFFGENNCLVYSFTVQSCIGCGHWHNVYVSSSRIHHTHL